MAFDFLHISDLFNTVVGRMRPTATVISLTQIGATNQYTLLSDKVYTAYDYNVAVGDWLDLKSAAGVIVGTYQVKGIDTMAKTFTVQVDTLPTATPVTWVSQAPYYEHGHVLEVSNTLSEKNNNATLKYQKYPLIVLVQDVKEVAGKVTATYSEPAISLFIATLTEPTYNAEYRKTNTFAPILYPLYQKLLYEIHFSRLFRTFSPKLIEHTKIDRYYWGKGGEFANVQNIFGDWLDAVEISDLNLKSSVSQTITTNIIH
jgi:hypothetical protein